MNYKEHPGHPRWPPSIERWSNHHRKGHCIVLDALTLLPRLGIDTLFYSCNLQQTSSPSLTCRTITTLTSYWKLLIIYQYLEQGCKYSGNYLKSGNRQKCSFFSPLKSFHVLNIQGFTGPKNQHTFPAPASSYHSLMYSLWLCLRQSGGDGLSQALDRASHYTENTAILMVKIQCKWGGDPSDDMPAVNVIMCKSMYV